QGTRRRARSPTRETGHSAGSGSVAYFAWRRSAHSAVNRRRHWSAGALSEYAPLRGVLRIGSSDPPEWRRWAIAQSAPALQPPSQTCVSTPCLQPDTLERPASLLLRAQASIRQEPLGGTPLPRPTTVPHRLPHARFQSPLPTA